MKSIEDLEKFINILFEKCAILECRVDELEDKLVEQLEFKKGD